MIVCAMRLRACVFVRLFVCGAGRVQSTDTARNTRASQTRGVKRVPLSHGACVRVSCARAHETAALMRVEAMRVAAMRVAVCARRRPSLNIGGA